MALSSEGYADLVKEHQADPAGTTRRLKEAFKERQLRADEFDLGRLFEACYGYGEFRRCRDQNQLATDVIVRHLQEGPGAVTSSNFLNISGQIVYSAVLEKYQAPEFELTNMIPVVPTQFLDGEKIAGVTQIGDKAQIRKETDPYPLAGVTEDWINTPSINDRGFIVPLTWEAVFRDRTGQLLERAGDEATAFGQGKEKRAADCLIDENVTTHRYNWRGTAIATYGDNSGTHTWDNLAASNALVDWVNLNAAEQLLNEMLDPYTGEPYVTTAKHLVVPKSLEHTAERIINATEIRVASPGFATTGNPTQTTTTNPYKGALQKVTSRYIAFRQATKTSWYYGDISKAFRFMQAQPMQVMQAPPNSEKEFNNGIVNQFRVNERGEFTTFQPRAMVKSTVA